jgi:hypothetical protein
MYKNVLLNLEQLYADSELPQRYIIKNNKSKENKGKKIQN